MSKTDTSKTHQEKAKAAIEKKASLGEDIDLTKYTDEMKSYARIVLPSITFVI